MGFFDTFRRKKEESPFSENNNAGLGEPPLDSHSSLNQPNNNLFSSPSDGLDSTGGMAQQNTPSDPRMSMPLGESLSRSHQNNPNSGFPNNHNQNPIKQDFELLSSKLDYLKASIEAVNQRLANLEHLVRQEQEKRKW